MSPRCHIGVTEAFRPKLVRCSNTVVPPGLNHSRTKPKLSLSSQYVTPKCSVNLSWRVI